MPSSPPAPTRALCATRSCWTNSCTLHIATTHARLFSRACVFVRNTIAQSRPEPCWPGFLHPAAPSCRLRSAAVDLLPNLATNGTVRAITGVTNPAHGGAVRVVQGIADLPRGTAIRMKDGVTNTSRVATVRAVGAVADPVVNGTIRTVDAVANTVIAGAWLALIQRLPGSGSAHHKHGNGYDKQTGFHHLSCAQMRAYCPVSYHTRTRR